VLILGHLNRSITKAKGTFVSSPPLLPLSIPDHCHLVCLPISIPHSCQFVQVYPSAGANWSHILVGHICGYSESVMGPKWSWLCRRMGIRDLLHCIHPSVNYNMIMFTFPSHYRYAFMILTISLLRSTVTQPAGFNRQTASSIDNTN